MAAPENTVRRLTHDEPEWQSIDGLIGEMMDKPLTAQQVYNMFFAGRFQGKKRNGVMDKIRTKIKARVRNHALQSLCIACSCRPVAELCGAPRTTAVDPRQLHQASVGTLCQV